MVGGLGDLVALWGSTLDLDKGAVHNLLDDDEHAVAPDTAAICGNGHDCQHKDIKRECSSEIDQKSVKLTQRQDAKGRTLRGVLPLQTGGLHESKVTTVWNRDTEGQTKLDWIVDLCLCCVCVETKQIEIALIKKKSGVQLVLSSVKQ